MFPATGATALLAFPPFEMHLIAWAALVPLMAATEGRPWHRLFTEGYLYGLGFYGVGLIWLPDAIGSFTSYTVPGSWGAFAAIAGFLSLFPAIFRWLLHHVRSPAVRLFVFAPALWLALDTVRRFAWGGLPWLELGASQLPGPLASAYPLVGQPGVTVMLVLLNGCIITLAAGLRDRSPGRHRDSAIIVTAVIVGGTALIGRAGWTEPAGDPIRLGIIDTRIEDLHQRGLKQRDALQDRYRSLIGNPPADADLLVLPEGALGPDSGALYRALSATSSESVAVLTGSLGTSVGGDRTNRAVLHTATGVASYRKQRLVPFAEARDNWLAGIVLGDADSALLPGHPEGHLSADPFDLAVAICWEIRFGNVIARQIRAGAEVIVNPANESWLGSLAAAQRSVATVGVRAAEFGRPALRITNSGPSAYFGPKGQLHWSGGGDRAGARLLTVQPYIGRTPYLALGMETVLRSAALPLVALFLAHGLLSGNPQRSTMTD